MNKRKFHLAFLENCTYKKQKKSIKNQRNFYSNTVVKLFANSVSVHSKIWFLRFSYSLVKLDIFQIKKSLTYDQKKHHERKHSKMSIISVNILKKTIFFFFWHNMLKSILCPNCVMKYICFLLKCHNGWWHIFQVGQFRSPCFSQFFLTCFSNNAKMLV